MQDLTIIMPSYNKAKYIREALDSIFMQETSYSYQIIIADDHSTDSTVEIVKEYQAKYPNKITLLESNVNQKLYKNVLRAYEITKTPYFCVLDPDDFWIDKFKIQKALDFLEKNKDFTIYVTNTLQQFSDGTRKKWSNNPEKDSDFIDFINGKAVLGCTLGSVYRNIVFTNGIPDKMLNLESKSCESTYRGDSFRNAIHINKGKAHSVRDFDAVYRITDEGIWQGMTAISQNILNIRLFFDLYNYFDKKYPELLLFAYKIYKNTKENILSLIDKETNIDELKIKINELDGIKKTFQENERLLFKTKVKNARPKYKVFLLIFRKLEKKLKRKGLI